MMTNSRRICIAAMLAMSVTAAYGGAVEDKAELAAIRDSATKYKDVEAALAAGYILAPPGECVDAALEGLPAEWGAMGLHYIHPGLLNITATEPRVNGGGTHTDFTEPAILLYEPQADGSLELVGVENLVFQKAWHGAGNDGPPVLLGRNWDTMADNPATEIDEAHGFEPHYDQHVWVFRENPSGPLMPFNPAVTCEHHKGG
jgi:hypothetical protein